MVVANGQAAGLACGGINIGNWQFRPCFWQTSGDTFTAARGERDCGQPQCAMNSFALNGPFLPTSQGLPGRCMHLPNGVATSCKSRSSVADQHATKSYEHVESGACLNSPVLPCSASMHYHVPFPSYGKYRHLVTLPNLDALHYDLPPNTRNGPTVPVEAESWRESTRESLRLAECGYKARP